MKIIEGYITSPFGTRRDPILSTVRIHQGIDIAAPIGTPVYSPCEGSVAAIYNHPTGGLTMILRSACGRIRYGFCHLSATEKKVADKVNRATMIARSGNSGRSTGAHLHYSVKRDGEWLDNQYVGGQWVDSSKHIEI